MVLASLLGLVSLCRLGGAEVPAPGVRPPDHVEVWLIDSAGPGRNPNLDLVLPQAADTVAALRAEGRTVLVHCVEAVSRTPAVAARYAARHLGIPVQQALRDVRAVLPAAGPTLLSWPPSTGAARPPLLLKRIPRPSLRRPERSELVVVVAPGACHRD